MVSWLDVILIAVQLAAAGIGGALYVASFLGYGGERGEVFIGAAFAALFLSSIPTIFRDHRFFKQNWGFGIWGLRSHFPLQAFPAREIGWLNPLAWVLFGFIALHFVLMAVTGMTLHSTSRDVGLRYPSLIIAVSGTLAALGRIYPPTKIPSDS